MVSEQAYSIHSPDPIVVAGVYWVKASQLPDQFTTVFADLERSHSAALPLSGSFEASCFRNIFNDYFATAEFIIPSESSKETQALLPVLKQTMEVVGDDELNLSYDEWVYLVTGWYPKNNKSMRLGSYARRAKLISPTLLLDRADADASVDIYGKYGAMPSFSYQKNLIAVEPSFLCFVAGIWEQPNSLAIYGPTDGNPTPDEQLGITGGAGGVTLTRYQGATPAKDVLDRGSPKGVELFRNSAAWLADPTNTDPIGDIGERASLNYWLTGDVSFDVDYDPVRIIQSGTVGVRRVPEAEDEEGEEAYPMRVDFHVGMSTLQHFPDA